MTATSDEGFSNSSLKNYDGKGTKYTNKVGLEAVYTPEALPAGKYKVYYWLIPNTTDGGIGFKTQVNANGASSELTFKTNYEGDAGWALLGEFDFKGDGTENVKGICIGGNARSTAVKFVPVQ